MSDRKRTYVVLLGVSGAGKGTQAKLLEQATGLPQVSTGDIFRYNLKNQTALGVLAKGYMDQGLLVPDDVTIRQVVEAVQGPMVMNDCTAPDGDCARMGTCCYHPLWAGAQALMRDYLDSVSLGDIVAHRQFPAVDSKFADRDAFPEYATCACACREE